jgi:hypothetical protein
MLINFTNHPSAQWSREQLAAAEVYGEIRDFPFPEVPAEWDEVQLADEAEICVDELAAAQPQAVVCQGESTLSAAVAWGLLARGIPVLAACSSRCVREERQEDGSTVKRVHFRFVRFRAYRLPKDIGSLNAT